MSEAWSLVYEGFRPEQEGLRETLCTLGNGRFCTRGAAPDALAGEVHYPGTYLAGGYFLVHRLDELDSGDIVLVGGESVSCGAMLRRLRQEDTVAADCFAATAIAYRASIGATTLGDRSPRQFAAPIDEAPAYQTTVGPRRQMPSDRPATAAFTVESGIDTISVGPDSFLGVDQYIAAGEARVRTDRDGH